MLLQNNYFRFGITLLLTAQYSLLRTTDVSTLVKPLPVIFWLIIVLWSPKRIGGKWVALSLFCAALGDILLDLGPDWLIIATVPFLASTLILALAFHRRGSASEREAPWAIDTGLIIPIAALAFAFHAYMAPLMGEASKIGAVLMSISALLLWRALALFLLKKNDDDPQYLKMIGFLGACGIVANYVLYSVNIGLRPIPRDLVIQLYYWGQAFAAWSFLKPYAPPTP